MSQPRYSRAFQPRASQHGPPTYVLNKSEYRQYCKLYINSFVHIQGLITRQLKRLIWYNTLIYFGIIQHVVGDKL